MTTLDNTLAKIGIGVRRPADRGWRVSAVKEPAAKRDETPPKRSLLTLFQRPEPTTYQRCLAVHIHFARKPSALS
jgi:hypothetical protein